MLRLIAALLLTLNPGTALSQPRHSVTVEHIIATAYCLTGKTASGPRTFPGCIALSRDLEKTLHAKFGDTIILHGLGVYTFADRMPPQWRKKVDVYLPSYQACRQFGARRTHITNLGRP